MPASRLRLLLAALVALFLWGLIAMMNLAISRAPVYGDHSTLRSDPLGAKALYETLAALPGLRVERNLRRPSRLAGVEATVFWLGSQPQNVLDWNKDDLTAFEAIVKKGGRLVLGVLPAGPAVQESPKPAQTKAGEKVAALMRLAEIEKRWQVRLARPQIQKANDDADGSPRQTALRLEPLTADWRCLQTIDHRCLAAERTFGAGTIVITLETFPLSNEGLRTNRLPQWISTLVGPGKRVIFDETHLGVEESGSIGTLIRQFRLEAAALMLVALAALFIWRNSTSLLPARAPAPDPGLAADPHRSMVLLLRRSITPSALGKTCLEEWQRAQALLPYRQRRRVAPAVAAAQSATTPLAAWQRVRQALQEKT